MFGWAVDMGALAQVIPWIPEDDLLLKNAVEAGASLESLAEGAVQFSRRFSIRELQDRWHALLYDPVVSAEAAFRMTELERTNPNFPTKFGRTGYSKENKSSSRKRNAVRSSYHSLRKKVRSEPFNTMDLGFFVQPNDSQFMETGDATHLGLEDSHMDIIHNAFPEILAQGGCVTTHVMSEDNLQGDIPYVGGENLTFPQHAGPSECDVVHKDSMQKVENTVHEAKTTIVSTVNYLAQLSNSLFEEDVETFMEVDGKEIDKSYYDGLSSLLGKSANVTNREALANSNEQEPPIAQTHPGDATLDDHVMPELDGTSAVSPMECKTVSDSPVLDPHPEIVGGVICCLLNREDPDIPCNDDIILSNNGHPMSVSSLARRNFKDTSNQITTCSRDLSASKNRSEGNSLQTQKKISGRSQGSIQGKPDMGQPSQGSKFKASTNAESHNTVAGGGSICAGSAQACSGSLVSAGTGTKDGNKEMASGTLFVGSHGHGIYPEKNSENFIEINGQPVNEAANTKDTDDGIEISDRELGITQTEAEAHACESDEDLPNYSDIEAMILDMDLEPDDQDNFDLEVFKYQTQDMKRTIIRLEQAAYSYMQRAIASRGAFAVLYGRYSKHYIKKPEVLVGRATEDLAVDIDLGKEKRGSKISRRQAIIRLGDDGVFHMKNLGKYPISVNEKEVDPGQSLILISDCLVEIRGMPFIFNTNQSCMKEYLKRTGKVN